MISLKELSKEICSLELPTVAGRPGSIELEGRKGRGVCGSGCTRVCVISVCPKQVRSVNRNL